MASMPGLDEEKFHDEVRWCITQLELGLQRQDPDSRQAHETVKILKILRSPKAPIVKKRIAMRNAFGDYRKKMKESEKKFLSGLRNSRFQTAANTKAHTKSKFLRQSHSRTADRDELGSHLSNLHLQWEHKPGDSEAGSSSGMASHGSLGVHGGGELSGTSIHNNSDAVGCARNPSHSSSADSTSAMTVAEKIDSSDNFQIGCGSQPDIQGLPSEASNSSSISNSFHFVPSDNSFCFGFSGEGDNRGGDEAADSDRSNVSPQIVDQSSGDSRVKPNAFKYEKTDNSFAFNFS